MIALHAAIKRVVNLSLQSIFYGRLHMAQQSYDAPPAVPVHPFLQGLAAMLILILITAFIILYILPPDVGGDLFAWPIGPRMSAMMLGATYLGGAYFFLIVLISRKWRHIRLGLLPVSVFAGTLGVATILHWDIFPKDHLAFQIWAFLYFTVPLFLPIVWYLHERKANPADIMREGTVPRAGRWAFGALGVILLVAGLFLFIFPQQMIALWPWKLSPLTSRVMAAMFLLPAVASLSITYDGSWSGTRYLLQTLVITIILILIATAVNRRDFDWASLGASTFVGGMNFFLILIAFTYLLKKPPSKAA
jgi:hypothetical protein